MTMYVNERSDDNLIHKAELVYIMRTNGVLPSYRDSTALCFSARNNCIIIPVIYFLVYVCLVYLRTSRIRS
jgi:hypothetical protein